MGCDLVLFGEMTQPIIMGILLQIMVGGVFMCFFLGSPSHVFSSNTPQVEDPPNKKAKY
jgi:uncharacterized integral membrane protein